MAGGGVAGGGVGAGGACGGLGDGGVATVKGAVEKATTATDDIPTDRNQRDLTVMGAPTGSPTQAVEPPQGEKQSELQLQPPQDQAAAAVSATSNAKALPNASSPSPPAEVSA